MNFTRIDVTNSNAPIAIARTSSMFKNEWTFSLLTQTVRIPCIWATAVTRVVDVNGYGTLFVCNKWYQLDNHYQSALQNHSFMTLVDAVGHPNIVQNISGLFPNNNRSLVALHHHIHSHHLNSCWPGNDLHTQQNKLKTANSSRLI